CPESDTRVRARTTILVSRAGRASEATCEAAPEASDPPVLFSTARKIIWSRQAVNRPCTQLAQDFHTRGRSPSLVIERTSLSECAAGAGRGTWGPASDVVGGPAGAKPPGPKLQHGGSRADTSQ